MRSRVGWPTRNYFFSSGIFSMQHPQYFIISKNAATANSRVLGIHLGPENTVPPAVAACTRAAPRACPIGECFGNSQKYINLRM